MKIGAANSAGYLLKVLLSVAGRVGVKRLVMGACHVKYGQSRGCALFHMARLLVLGIGLWVIGMSAWGQGLDVTLSSRTNVICYSEAIGAIDVSVTGGTPPYSYLWTTSNGGIIPPSQSNIQDLTLLVAGTYNLLVKDANSVSSGLTVIITQPVAALGISASSKSQVCQNTTLNLTSSISGGTPGYSFSWSGPDSFFSTLQNPIITTVNTAATGIYKLTVSDMNGCSVKDSVILRSMHEICLIIPDAISPNRDLVNDVWNIGNIELYPDVEITIYNRWGQMVWHSDRGYTVPWNGRSRGEDLPIDSYHYLIDLHNGSKPIIGDVTIVR